MDATHRPEQKPATAARIYDYYIGGTHNFPADRAAAEAAMERAPRIRAVALANRAFLRRAVRAVTDAGIRQFIDLGSGIPTEGNVHEIAQGIAPDARVVYVDIDPVAVAEALEILDGNDNATAIRGNLRDAATILSHPEVTRLIDFTEPVAFLLCAVLHFMPDEDEARNAVAQLHKAASPGSFLIISHATPDEVRSAAEKADEQIREQGVQDVYTRQTTTPFRMRSRADIAAFFTGFDLIEPGLTWVSQWRPDDLDPIEFRDSPQLSAILGGVATLR